jgi:hypothetical protein
MNELVPCFDIEAKMAAPRTEDEDGPRGDLLMPV